MGLLIAGIAFIFGLVIGSFLNVVIYRVPRRQSIVSPGSMCPSCKKEIAPYDNIPVLSWLILRGKCRHCHNPISPRYPLVEALTGLAFAAIAWAVRLLGWSVVVAFALCIVAAAVIAVVAISVDRNGSE